MKINIIIPTNEIINPIEDITLQNDIFYCESKNNKLTNNKHLFIFTLSLFTKHCSLILLWTLYYTEHRNWFHESCDVRNIHQTSIKNVEGLVSL